MTTYSRNKALEGGIPDMHKTDFRVLKDFPEDLLHFFVVADKLCRDHFPVGVVAAKHQPDW